MANDCEMPDTTLELWCLFQGDRDHIPFPVTTSPTTSIGMLKEHIHKEREYTNFKGVNASDLNLWQVRYF